MDGKLLLAPTFCNSQQREVPGDDLAHHAQGLVEGVGHEGAWGGGAAALKEEANGGCKEGLGGRSRGSEEDRDGLEHVTGMGLHSVAAPSWWRRGGGL